MRSETIIITELHASHHLRKFKFEVLIDDEGQVHDNENPDKKVYPSMYDFVNHKHAMDAIWYGWEYASEAI